MIQIRSQNTDFHENIGKTSTFYAPITTYPELKFKANIIFGTEEKLCLKGEIISHLILISILKAPVTTVAEASEWLVLPTSDHKVPGLNPAGGGIDWLSLQ